MGWSDLFDQKSVAGGQIRITSIDRVQLKTKHSNTGTIQLPEELTSRFQTTSTIWIPDRLQEMVPTIWKTDICPVFEWLKQDGCQNASSPNQKPDRFIAIKWSKPVSITEHSTLL